MHGPGLKAAREQAGKSQLEVSRRLGVSQGYISLLETAARRVPPQLARRFVKLYGLAPTALPLEDCQAPARRDPQVLAEELAALGYPGFSYMKTRKRRNPAQVLIVALSQHELESRVAEALPWILLHYPGIDRAWLVEQTRLRNLQNRLGFVVTLARQMARQRGRPAIQLQTLAELESELEESRLAREDTFCRESLSQAERRWLREIRPQAAAHWNLLTDWRPETVRYA